jgi:hypothetical protein
MEGTLPGEGVGVMHPADEGVDGWPRTEAGRIALETEPLRIVAYYLRHVRNDQWEGSLVASNYLTALMFLDRFRDRRLPLDGGRTFEFVVIEFSPPAVFRVTGRISP